MSKFVKFYQGTESEYKDIKDSGMLEDYFYFTKDETDGRYRLRLKEEVIYSSNDKEEIAEKVMGSEAFNTKIAEYLPLTGGTITGNLTVQQAVKVDSLDATNNISAKNFKYQNNTVTIPCALVIQGKATMANLVLDNITVSQQGTLNNCTLNTVQGITFKDGLILNSLPVHQSASGFSFDFDNGILKVNSIDASSIKINGQDVLTEEADSITKVYKNIQIGNIILSDDGNGNLAITSVN